ncbi:protein kinase [Streptomyces sp. A73]|uniref:serine/threonine protein kinase n=1 Tax=Streptomyces smyrnaeus TaxID=1387713 RepID=UPI001B6E231A|nr:protein kinase [Streptomyces sp. A73]
MWELAPSDPRVVGSYRTRAVLGEGGMGRVLLATDAAGGLVAVKLVRDVFAAYDDSFRQRLRREAVAAQRVRSLRTAVVVDADVDAGVPWLAYEFHHGPTLQRALKAAVLPEDSVLHLAAGLATALRDIHAARFVHRDLSIANVLLAADGPVVIDFGIARSIVPEAGASEQTQLVTVTRTGVVIGNPGFMSPEQAMGMSELTPASDIFSLGTLLATAATGRNPFQGASGEETRFNVMMAHADLDRIPAALSRVIEACLERDPARRPDAQTVLAGIGTPPDRTSSLWPEAVHTLIREQQSELRRYTEIEPTTVFPGPHDLDPTKIFTTGATDSPEAEPESGPEPAPEPGARPSRSWRARLAVAALAVVVVLGAWWTASALTDSGGPEDTPQAGPSADTAASGHPFVDVSRGDCFRNTGTMQEMDFEPAKCGGREVFEVLRAFDNTTDRSVCDYVDHVEWRYSARDPDVTVCLVYRHSDGAAYNADRGDCVDGGTEGRAWTVKRCRPSGMVVVGRIEGRSSSQDCERVPHNKRDHYFTVEGSPELNVRLCMGMIGPGT